MSDDICQNLAEIEANLDDVVAETEAWAEAFFAAIDEPGARAAAGLPPATSDDWVRHGWILQIAGCYVRGDGVDRDIEKAMALLEQPAAEGSSQAQHNLASLQLFRTDDPALHVRGVEQLSAEYENGSAFAAGKLGWAYQLGLGVEADLDRALTLYLHAARQGMTYWQYLLAHAHEQGYLGLALDPEYTDYWLAYELKVHYGVYECWVAHYYDMGIFPDNAEIEAEFRERCDQPPETGDP